VTEDLSQAMNICATDFPPKVNELEMAGLTTVASQTVRVPRIKEAHAALECRHYMTIKPGRGQIILGQVVSVYIEDQFIDPNGPYVLAEHLHAIGRMNGLGSYVKTRDSFMTIPRIPYAEWFKGHPTEGDKPVQT